MKLLTILLGISCGCLVIAGIFYSIIFFLKKIWKVEEFTGSFWNAITLLSKLFSSIGIIMFSGSILTGLLLLFKYILVFF